MKNNLITFPKLDDSDSISENLVFQYEVKEWKEAFEKELKETTFGMGAECSIIRKFINKELLGE